MPFTNDDKKYIKDTVSESVDNLAHIRQVRNELKDNIKRFVYRYEFEDLMARVKYLETKLNIDSGK